PQRLCSTSFLFMLWPPPSSTLFPYTTLFRSRRFDASTPRRLTGKVTCGKYSNDLPNCLTMGQQVDCRVASNFPSPARYPCENIRSEEHTSELQSRRDLVCRLLLEKKNSVSKI